MTTEPCGEVMQVVRCDLPADQPHEMHHAELALPPDLNRLVEVALRDLERRSAQYRRARRWGWFMFGAWAASLGVYLWLILSGIT
jgi:hypothetical protein